MTKPSTNIELDFLFETAPAKTVPELCDARRISKSFFYKLVRQGKGPRIMKIGRRSLISAKAEADWCREMESQTAEDTVNDDE